MQEHYRQSALTDDERLFLHDLMPAELDEISEAGIQPHHVQHVTTIAGRGLSATYVAGAQQLLARHSRHSITSHEQVFPVDNGLHVAFSVNTSPMRMLVDSRVTLLDALREQMGLTGTKKGCDHGQCGACTVLIDGRRVLACLTLLATCEGRSVTNIEGLAEGSVGSDSPAENDVPPPRELHPRSNLLRRSDAGRS